MPTYANVTPIAAVDGVLYANAVPLTSTEADLGTAFPVLYGQSVLAIVQFSISGYVNSNQTYVVMQVDLGGAWVDVAWVVFTGNSGLATFVLSGGGVGNINNAFQQSRNANSAPSPAANGSNQMILGGRVRFVGRASLTGGSSAVPGTFIGVTATIRYKLLGLV